MVPPRCSCFAEGGTACANVSLKSKTEANGALSGSTCTNEPRSGAGVRPAVRILRLFCSGPSPTPGTLATGEAVFGCAGASSRVDGGGTTAWEATTASCLDIGPMLDLLVSITTASGPFSVDWILMGGSLTRDVV